MTNILHIEGNLLQIRGATRVVSSTPTQAFIETGARAVVIAGDKIEVKKLNLEENEVYLQGEFVNIKFTNSAGKKGSFLKRIFK